MNGTSQAAAAERAEPPVLLERMTRRFDDLVAVDSLSFEVRRGEMFGLIGPDGAGKTTTLRVILGLLRPDEGQVLTCGLNPAARRKALSRKIGYLSQRFTLYGDLSVDENIAFFAEIYGVPDWRTRRDELLGWLRLAPFRDRLAERLSGGMKQKLALACTLVHTPELLVLDEPTTGVDPVSRREFWRALARLQREGMTILVTTPYLDEAERCQRVGLLDHGRLLDLNTPEALRRGASRSILEVIARPKRAALDWLRRAPEAAEVETFGERLHVTLRAAGSESEASREAERLSAGLRAEGMEVDSCRVIPPSLEDLFIARTRSREPEGRDMS